MAETNAMLRMALIGAAGGAAAAVTGYSNVIRKGEPLDFAKAGKTVLLGAIAGAVGSVMGLTEEQVLSNPLYLTVVYLIDAGWKLKDGVKVGPLLPPAK